MQINQIDIAGQILMVVATLLPLTAILLQFMLRFYEPKSNDSKGWEDGGAAVYFSVVAIASLVAAGFTAAEIIKLNSESTSVANSLTFVQMTFGFLLIAILYVSRDIFNDLGVEFFSFDFNIGIPNFQSTERADATDTNSDNENSEVTPRKDEEQFEKKVMEE